MPSTTALTAGSSVTLTVVEADTLLIDSQRTGSAIVEAVSGVPGSANRRLLVTHPGGQATYGPFGAGTIKLSAVGGDIAYMQGSPQLDDGPQDVKFLNGALVSADGNPIGGGLPSQIAHSTVIPLDNSYVMAQYTITGPITYTRGARKAGGSCVLRLISDGVNAPVLPGVEWASSYGFDNTQAGLLNVVNVWTDDGVNVYHSIGQPAVNAPIDTTAPTLTHARVNEATAKIVLTYGETLDDQLAGAITVGGPARSIVSTTVVGATVEIVMSAPYAVGEVPTVTMAAGTVRDAVGNPAAALAAQTVTVIQTQGLVVRIGSLTAITESGDGTNGWNYVGSGGAGYSGQGVSALRIAANTEGSFQYTMGAAVNNLMFGLKSAATAGGYNSFEFTVQANVGSIYQVFTGTTGLTETGPNTSCAAGDIVRIRRINTSSVWTVVAEVSKDSGGSWIVIHTWTASAFLTSALYLGLNMTNVTPGVLNIRGSGVV